MFFTDRKYRRCNCFKAYKRYHNFYGLEYCYCVRCGRLFGYFLGCWEEILDVDEIFGGKEEEAVIVAWVEGIEWQARMDRAIG